MNEILELIEKARIEVGCDDYCNEVMENLALLVEAKHKEQIIAAFNRGKVSMMGMGAMKSADEYYNDTYAQ